MRFATSLAGALLCASLGVHAQGTTTATTTDKANTGKKGDAITYTGCVATGTETQTFILDKVVPVTTTRTVAGTGGTVSSTSTSYVLVPGDQKVELQTYVGKKVEVTGMMIPEGEWKTKTKTKIESEGSKDTTIKSTTKGDSDAPHFRVLSVKQLNEPCM
jgi:hypothetical protein